MADSARDPQADEPAPNEPALVWPADGLQAIPDWVYTSETIYRREIDRIFHGRTWNFVALEAELPEPGCFKRSFVGPTPIVVAREVRPASFAVVLETSRFVT